MKKSRAIWCAPLVVAAFLSCGQPAGDSGSGGAFTLPGESYGTRKTVSVTVPAATAGDTLYLVKVNPGGAAVSGEYTGRASSSAVISRVAEMPREHNLSPYSGGEGEFRRIHHRQAAEWNAQPPVSALPEMARSASQSLVPSLAIIDTVQSVRNFWVDYTDANGETVWRHIPAVLRKNGAHCRIWVADENYNNSSVVNTDEQITDTQINAIADKFDAIYPMVTGVFGYEYGGNGGGGGIDGDAKILILVYDIDFDYAGNQTSGVFGYFWPKDEFPQTYSNEAEIFYVDAYFTDRAPDHMYSTLIHEFQHMIHFNEKTLRLGRSTQAWYNEMLSMLAEDLFCAEIGIDTGDNAHPIQSRIPLFRTYYWARGATAPGDYWGRGSDIFVSYSNTYAFGAYLVRNYGGAALLRAMAANGYVDEASVNSALQQLTGNRVTFAGALEQFPLALFNNASAPGSYTNGVLQAGKIPTFNNTVNGDSVGLTGRDFAAFDITGIRPEPAEYPWLQKGDMPPNGIDIQLFTVRTANPQLSVTYYTGSPVRLKLAVKKQNGGTVTIQEIPR